MDPKPEPTPVEPWDVTTPLDEISHEIAHAKKGAFLAAFAQTGNITAACHASQIARRTHYDWLEGDEKYAEGFAEAQKVANDYLLAEARRRAVQGSRRYKFHEGHLITIPATPNEPGAWREEVRCEVVDEGARPKFIETPKGTKEVHVRDVWVKPYEEFVYSDQLLMMLMGAEDDKYRKENGKAGEATAGEEVNVKRIVVHIADVHPDDLPNLHRLPGVAPISGDVYDPKTKQTVKRKDGGKGGRSGG